MDLLGMTDIQGGGEGQKLNGGLGCVMGYHDIVTRKGGANIRLKLHRAEVTEKMKQEIESIFRCEQNY